MTTPAPRKRKLRGIIRTELNRIEDLLRTGYTVAGVIEMLSAEMGIAIKSSRLRTVCHWFGRNAGLREKRVLHNTILLHRSLQHAMIKSQFLRPLQDQIRT